MTVNRSDFQRRFKAEPDSGDRFIGQDTDDGSADPFVTDLAGMAGGLAPLIAVDTELSSRYVPLTATVAPGVIIPPASILTPAIPTTWFAANYALAHRFELIQGRSVRYILGPSIGISSGNIQAGILALSGANRLTFTRVAHTGVIACPAAANMRFDLGVTALAPGDYAVFFWADNTTVTAPNSAHEVTRVMRMVGAYTNAAGVPASGTLESWTTRFLPGIALEGDV